MNGSSESGPGGAGRLDYTRLGTEGTWIEWRPDENGITFVGRRERPAKVVLVVSLLAFLALVMSLLTVNVLWHNPSWEKLFAILPAAIVNGSVAGAVAQIRSMITPPRLRVDRDGAVLIVPDVFGVRRQQFAKSDVRLAIKTEATLAGPVLGSLTLRRHGKLFGRRVFTAYPRDELDQLVAATQSLWSAQGPPPSISVQPRSN